MNIFIEVRYQFNDRNLWIYLAAWAQIVINSKQHMNLQGIFSSQFSQINRNTSLDSDGSPNTSIINQLNLLEGDYTEESRVVKIESFIYAEMEKQIPSTPYQQLKRSNHYRNQLSRNLSPVSANKYQQIGKDNRIKSIREELIQQNQILQKKLSQNHNYITSFPSKKIIERERYVSPSILQKQYQTFPQKKSLESQQKIKGDDQIFQKLQQQYNNSKIIKLYNFIIKQLPNCSKCHTPCAHLTKLDNKVAFSCKQCQKQKNILLPIMGVLYDLQNKGRFQQEITIFQTLFEKVDGQISKLQKQIESLQVLKQKLTNLKNTSRKKYKEINQSKYYLKKHINNLQKHHLLQFQKLLPKQYIEQVELWQDIKSQSKRFMQENYNILSKITPIFLHQKINSKLLSNLQKILNYQKQQSVKISISEHIKFPIKKIDSAVFVVDGSYNLPVFQNIRHLHLQFQNKKTLRQLSLLFSNFPRQIFSLSFKYNHKVHSHISAEGFPFMQFIATFPSIKKLDVVIENSKEFFDIVEMCKGMTPKIEIRLKITKHIFSKNGLLLPLNYYSNLFQCFGDQVAKIELNLPQSVDSPAVINYKNLIYKKNLCIFRLDRGEKEEKNMKKLRMLNQLQGQNYNHERYVFKKILASKIRLINMIKSTKYQFHKNPTLLSSILNFLI